MVMATEVEKDPGSVPSVKDLASSEPSLRRKNLQQIITHLETCSPSQQITHTAALQLWRGFHVALYMHDSKNQLSVQKLIATLANTFRIVRSKDIEIQTVSRSMRNGDFLAPTDGSEAQSNGGDRGANEIEEDEFDGFDDKPHSDVELKADDSWLSTYSTAFWEIMAREWSGIDQWRINKYLLLIRFVLRELFDICLTSHFGLEEIHGGNEPSQGKITLPSEQKPVAAADSKPSKRKAKASTAAVAADIDDDDSNPRTEPSRPAKRSKPTKPPPSLSLSSSSLPSLPQQPQPPQAISPPFQVTKSQLSILSTHPLSPRSRTVSDGLRLHMLDIYLDELFHAVMRLQTLRVSSAAAVGATTVADDGGQTMRTLLGDEFMAPVRQVASDALAKHVRTRAKEVLVEFDARVREL